MLESHKIWNGSRSRDRCCTGRWGRAWLMTHGPPWHGGAANYRFLASDRFRSRALVGGEMDRVTQRLHIDRVVLLVDAGHRMCCRRYGHDHRPAMITQGT
jgi:hypothetical protein